MTHVQGDATTQSVGILKRMEASHVMGVELNIRITSPLDAEDRELLSGIAVMTLAIANHEMAKQAFPDAFGDGDAAANVEPPAPCGVLDPAGEMICIGHAGHRGRHKFRAIVAEPVEGLAN